MGSNICFFTKKDVQHSKEILNNIFDFDELLAMLLTEVTNTRYSIDIYESYQDLEIEKEKLEDVVNYLKDEQDSFPTDIKMELNYIENNSSNTINDIIKFLEKAIKKADSKNGLIKFDWI